ncbi:sigma-54-dependent transcriptional regulator [Paludibacterium purpuratum]|uniref:Two-component system C4-dicarboxylate transport response regulator DctD/two-component system response regulator AauR n=1 Tax=Paludibacterium purpuratum TaxID=1144873 RepID=A0A4R7B6F0_9NEIS|nr:sigma-54 dependent transcriptional regulator [Paludibacterium purpuratum]TDR80218.1 two-component system C4-dicarboxylate transport response regulator DctD/two-component system response regulator AauR [Paludibacterium purpuratum]
MKPIDVLVIEDDPDVMLGCLQALALAGIGAHGVDSVEAARQWLTDDFDGVLVSDIRLPGMDGLTFLREQTAVAPQRAVILITGHGDIAMAVQAMRDGAWDFIEKPFLSPHLVEVVKRALEKCQLSREVRNLRRQVAAQGGLAARLIGNTEPMTRLRKQIEHISKTSADVLIQGETGTGKELVARCLHDLSGRSGPFVALNCAGLPETLFDSEMFGHEAGAFSGASKRRIGKIEFADHGTLFLDEIESMPLSFQVKLLRVLQERTLERLGGNQSIAVDFRVIAASKEDLLAASDAGRFRRDLYYRLNVVTLRLPTLRSRREDIALLFDHFTRQFALRHDCPPPTPNATVIADLMLHDWPGNVRELRNMAERYLLGLDLQLDDETPVKRAPLAEAVDAFERMLIEQALRQHNGNLSRAAEALAVARTTLHDKIRKHGLDGKDG